MTLKLKNDDNYRERGSIMILNFLFIFHRWRTDNGASFASRPSLDNKGNLSLRTPGKRRTLLNNDGAKYIPNPNHWSMSEAFSSDKISTPINGSWMFILFQTCFSFSGFLRSFCKLGGHNLFLVFEGSNLTLRL